MALGRDDFSVRTKDILAKRVAYTCSNPTCGCITIGPHEREDKATTFGVAAHICAASPLGPRFDEFQSSYQRKSITNGIWLCSNCSTLIDKDHLTYPKEVLLGWKIDAEKKMKKALESRFDNVRLSESQPGRSLLFGQTLTSIKPGLSIDRRQLIEDLYDFAQQGNGLIIGGPGYGKTFIINALQRLSNEKKIPCLVIRINDLVSGNEAELNAEFNFSANWLQALRNGSPITGEEQGLLIFDAFDTAKDESLKLNMLKHIKAAINQLAKKWVMLVSVRTYDATKSARLVELFPETNIKGAISCRNFKIPELSIQELSNILESNPQLNINIESASPEFLILLRVPYFLKIYEALMSDENLVNDTNLSKIETEAQLLEIFWRKRVEINTKKDVLIRKLTFTLIGRESLIVGKDEILNDVNTDVFDDLISSGVIQETSVMRQNIGFTHNILLDFAISKYVLKEEVGEQIQYVENNKRTPFIFRQSFIYFYSQLWSKSNNSFWVHYWQVVLRDVPLFRLFRQTVLNYVVVTLYKSTADLKEVVFDRSADTFGTNVKKILEAIRFVVKDEFRTQDIDLLVLVSKNIHSSFLWELGVLIERAIRRSKNHSDQQNLLLLSSASINYIRFVLGERKQTQERRNLEANGGRQGIKNICDTFSLERGEIKSIILEILDLLIEQDFPISFFTELSDNILTIFMVDQDLGSLIYKKLYSHHETSESVTYLGNSAIIALRSTRRQDFQHVHFMLEKAFPKLLSADFNSAMAIGISIVNKASDLSQYPDLEISKLNLTIGQESAIVVSDFVYADDEDLEHGPFSHLAKIFNYLDMFIPGEGTQEILELALCQLISQIRAAKLWRALLKYLSKSPEKFRSLSFQILVNTPLYTFEEVSFHCGALLTKVWPFWSEHQKKEIEDAILGILSLPSNHDDVVRQDEVCRGLSNIPEGEMVLEESRSFFLRHGKSYLRTVSTSANTEQASSSKFTDRVVYLGLDPSSDDHISLLERVESMEKFNAKFSTNAKIIIAKYHYTKQFPAARLFFQLSREKKFMSEHLRIVCEYELAKFIKVLSRAANRLSHSAIAFIESVAKHLVESSVYKLDLYEPGNVEDNWGAFIPSARTESIETIVKLLYQLKTNELAEITKRLMFDNHRPARLLSINALGYFWHNQKEEFWCIVSNRVFHEEDSKCLVRILDVVCYDDVIRADLDRTENVASTLVEALRKRDGKIDKDLWEYFTVLLLRLIRNHSSTLARQIVTDNLAIKDLCMNLIYHIMKAIDPHDPENDYVLDRNLNLIFIQIVSEILEYRFKSIKSDTPGILENNDCFEIIDHTIDHLYFAIELGKGGNKGKELTKENLSAFYQMIKPVLNTIVERSVQIDSGFMLSHTAYYLMKILNRMIDVDPVYVLYQSNRIVRCAERTGFTYDSITLNEVVVMAESLLVDYKQILLLEDNFENLIYILDRFAESGWQEALEFTWRLREAF